jgi:hypothetical protein
MSLHLIIGLELDGTGLYADRPGLNAMTTGPMGLLNLLETHLGLLRTASSDTDRVLQLRECLKACDHPQRFFHASFAVDELGCAQALLAWRDSWYLHGWNGQRFDTSLSRLRDMQDIEQHIAGRIAPSIGERLLAVQQALAHRLPPFARVLCIEPIAHWPQSWQRVLQLLNADVQVPSFPLATESSSMLHQLQRACKASSKGEKVTPLKWIEDGSVHVVRADTQLLAGQWLASHLAGASEQTLVLAEQPDMLDDLLAAANLARPGLGQSSRFRPALQLLSLALETVWLPLDVYRLLALLSHPFCPLPRLVRERLATALTSSPGVGNQAWQHGLTLLEDVYLKNGWQWQPVRDRIAFWLESDRYDPVSGAPISHLIERIDDLLGYIASQIDHQDGLSSLTLAPAMQQGTACKAALSTLLQQQHTFISRQQLQLLIKDLSGSGINNPAQTREVGSIQCLTRPGAVLQPAEQVVWWNLAAPPMPASYPWSAAEIRALQAANIQLPAISSLLERQAQAWLAPILAARRQLILVLPAAGAELHPLWLQLESLFPTGHGPGIQTIENLLRQGEPGMLAAPPRPLPGLRRWWQLSEGVALPKRSVESFSSLEPFLFNPYQWVLRYPAALQVGTLLTVPQGMQLLGTLSHRLIECWFSLDDALTRSGQQFDDWFGPAFSALIAAEGSTLLLPGMGVELEAFRQQMYQSLLALRRHVTAADIVKVECEPLLEGQFTGGKLAGRADLLLTNRANQQAIVDMKWLGEKKYGDKLANNSHLQLALYGQLLQQKTGAWPNLAYFIISSGQLIAENAEFFPSACVRSKQPHCADEAAPHLWLRFLQTWRWRRRLLDSGGIEVALTLDESSEAPPDGVALEVLNPKYNEFLSLAGWKATQ